MKGILHFITGAPWWVSALLAYLLYIGFKATKPQTIWLPRLFILPILLTSLFLINLLQGPTIQLDVLAAYFVSFIVGSMISWFIVRRVQLTFDKPKLLLTLPGSYITLIILISLFSFKYYCGYIEATQPTQLPTYWVYLKTIPSGFFSGLSMGQALTYLYRFLQA